MFATPWTIAHQAPLSMGFPRPKYWNGVPFPSPGPLPIPGIDPGLSSALQVDSLPLNHQGSPCQGEEREPISQSMEEGSSIHKGPCDWAASWSWRMLAATYWVPNRCHLPDASTQPNLILTWAGWSPHFTGERPVRLKVGSTPRYLTDDIDLIGRST